MPVRRRFSLTQEGLGRVILSDEGPGNGINVWRRDVRLYDCRNALQYYVLLCAANQIFYLNRALSDSLDVKQRLLIYIIKFLALLTEY